MLSRQHHDRNQITVPFCYSRSGLQMLTFLSMCHDIIGTVFSPNSPGVFLGAMRTMESNQIWSCYEKIQLLSCYKVSVALSSPGEQEETLPKNRDSLSIAPTDQCSQPATLILLCPYFHKVCLPKLPRESSQISTAASSVDIYMVSSRLSY